MSSVCESLNNCVQFKAIRFRKMDSFLLPSLPLGSMNVS